VKVLRVVFITLLVVALTVLTQVGGIILLLYLPLSRLLNLDFKQGLERWSYKALGFAGLYLIVTMLVIPHLAPLTGRVPLPIFKRDNLQPRTILTCLLNRHYVKPELQELLIRVGQQMQQSHPNSTVTYLDAGFPFIDGFPLFPHLSHSDGEKVDVAFLYTDQTGQPQSAVTPSWIGYGAFEGPLPKEFDQPAVCAEKGYWQYNMASYLTLEDGISDLVFDPVRTRNLIRFLATDQQVGKVFLEPHLKERLSLRFPTIRFHGCRAVRHDDHVHVQL